MNIEREPHLERSNPVGKIPERQAEPLIQGKKSGVKIVQQLLVICIYKFPESRNQVSLTVESLRFTNLRFTN